MPSASLTGDFAQDRLTLDRLLRVKESFDLVQKPLDIGSRPASLYFVDGFIKDDVMEKILNFLLSTKPEEMDALSTPAAFAAKKLAYVEVNIESKLPAMVTAVLSGAALLLVEGYNRGFLIDARTYPARGVEEPDDDRVLRGSRDGFVETLVFNTALIRRRIRDPHLTMEMAQAGRRSKTDIVLCYLKGLADERVLAQIRERLSHIQIDALVMSQESLAECLIRKQWYNPFPRVRYTSRPDTASAHVLEGKILLIVDNSPSVMILPTSLFDFTQDTNDFYFPPLVGTYLRLVRISIFLLTLFLTPVWYLLIEHPGWIPPWLSFIQISEPNSVPVLAQLLLIEFIIDGLKLASLNTPNVLSNSFSVVGALILGDFAVQAKWFVPEVVLYMAFVAIANFTQPSFELGYAFKLFRVVLLLLTALFDLWGLLGGIGLMLLVAAATKTITGRNYLFPIVPFNGRALLGLFLRRPINRRDS